MTYAIFVYGTLKPGCSNFYAYNDVISGHHEATINADLYALGQIPGITNIGSDSVVKGSVIYTNFDGLLSFDALEGHPNLYTRTKVHTIEGEEVWVYVYNGRIDDRTKIEHGNFQEIMVNTNEGKMWAVPLEEIVDGKEIKIIVNNYICKARLT